MFNNKINKRFLFFCSISLLIYSPIVFILILPILISLLYLNQITKFEILVFLSIILLFWYFGFCYYSHILILDGQFSRGTCYLLNESTIVYMFEKTVNTPSIFRPLFVETIIIYELVFSYIGLTPYIFF